MQTSKTDSLHDELATALGEPADTYRVECVLKSTPGELTQLVWLRTATGGELGPYVRKIIDAAAGIGGVYEQLYERQQLGARYRQLPRIVSCERCGGKLVVVMERIPGHTLREAVEAIPPEGRLAFTRRIVPQLCAAADELHTAFELPVIHRDLTPSNFICPSDAHALPVLIDLGIARAWHEGAETDTMHLGTRAYAPPEQYGFGQTDVRTDVYALGMLAFFCLTGRDPEPLDRERGFADPSVPDGWRGVIARACALDPATRHASAAELAAAFAALGEGSAAQTTSQPVDARERIGGLRRAAAPARCVAIAVLAAAIIAASVYDAVTPEQWNQPTMLQNIYDYLVFVPVLVLGAAYGLMDRRYLRERIAWFGRIPAGRARLVVLVACAVSIVIFFALVALQV